MRPRAPIAPAAITITRRNATAATGFDWAELRAFAEQADPPIPVGKVGRVEFILAADLVEALSGLRSRPWSDSDTEREIAEAVAPASQRRSAGAR